MTLLQNKAGLPIKNGFLKYKVKFIISNLQDEVAFPIEGYVCLRCSFRF
jgi:hypothetical protein